MSKLKILVDMEKIEYFSKEDMFQTKKFSDSRLSILLFYNI